MNKPIAFILALALVACGGSDDTGAVNDEVGSDVGSADGVAPAEGAVGEYVPLTRENFERWLVAFEAVVQLVNSDPALVDALNSGSEESAQATLARFQAQPRIVATLRDNGLTPAQYVGFMQTLSGAMFAHAMSQTGQRAELPPQVRQADVDFYVENQQWIQEQWGSIQAIASQADSVTAE